MHKSLNTYKYLYRLEGFESSNTSSFSLSQYHNLNLSGDSSFARFKLAEGAVLVNDIAIRFILGSFRSAHTVRGRIRFKETVSHWTRIFFISFCLICLLHSSSVSHTQTHILVFCTYCITILKRILFYICD